MLYKLQGLASFLPYFILLRLARKFDTPGRFEMSVDHGHSFWLDASYRRWCRLDKEKMLMDRKNSELLRHDFVDTDTPVMVLTEFDAETILWADGYITNELSLSGVVEWDMLVEKAQKVKALQK